MLLGIFLWIIGKNSGNSKEFSDGAAMSPVEIQELPIEKDSVKAKKNGNSKKKDKGGKRNRQIKQKVKTPVRDILSDTIADSREY